MKLLAKVIKATGWRRAIVVSDRSGLIIKGHGTLLAAKLLGVKQVPVDVQHYPDEAAETRDLIADNRIPELSYRENRSVVALLKELEAKGAEDIDLTGYSRDEFDVLLKSLEASAAEDGAANASAGGEGEADTMLVIGAYRIPIKRLDYAAWLEKLRQQVGFDTPAIHAEIKRRMGLS